MAMVLPLLLSYLRLVSSSPVPQQATHASLACSQIQSSLAPIANPQPGSSVTGTVPAQLAWDCLQSIPLNATGALDLVHSLKPYVQFQSTLAWLKNPPAEYAEKLFGPVDLLSGLDNIADKVKNEQYGGEYDFGFELYKLFQSAHDGHLYFVPDVVNSLFQWYRPLPLVSVSDDGYEIPGIFAYSDILLAGKDSSFKPSAVEEIDDHDVKEYLDKLSQIGSLQDRDALYNTVFYSLPQLSLGPDGLGTGVFSGGGRGRIEYPGSQTSVKFENGTRITIDNLARVTKDFTGISSGTDVYSKYFNIATDMSIDLLHGQNLSSDPRLSKSQEAHDKSKKDIPAPGYPKPIVRMSTNEVGGYYLEGEGYNDTAVLTVYSFVGGEGQVEFQQTTRGFLSQAKADGKKKLIIDVSGNGGGTIWLGYELFAQLFPSIDPYGGNRFRAHQAWDEMGKFDSTYTANLTRSMTGDPTNWDWLAQPMNYRSDLTEEGKPFTSWAEKYGPHPANGDLHTTVQRWDLNDSFGPYYSGLDQLTGHGLPTLDLPFKAEDMVIMYDGYCASTCTIFSEFMRRQAGVDTIAMGGRPNDDIIQAVGGTKGTNNWGWSDVIWFVLSMYDKASQDVKEKWSSSELASFNTFLPFKRMITAPQLNMRDGVRPGGETTPLQFIVEPADCRLYYTPEMVVDVTKMWSSIADTKWLGKRQCVAGGFKSVPSSFPDWDGDDNERKLVRRAKKVKQISKTATVPNLDSGRVAALEDSFNVFTEFELGTKANGMMMP
jgi:Peptidase family S41